MVVSFEEWNNGTTAIGIGSESNQSLPLTLTTMLLLNDIGIDLFDAKQRGPLHSVSSRDI